MATTQAQAKAQQPQAPTEAKRAKPAVDAPANMMQWIEDNKASFVPPVCNKLMKGHGQLKIMFVGGPNQRRDFHIEEGEELFYQVKGDMVLRVMERGQPKDIRIKEGEIFVLPGRIPHSPQRFADTVGLVIERERLRSEWDGLRYYQADDSTPLWERWFYCEDLGKQLGPVITEYFASKAHETGQPQDGDVHADPPVEIDTTSTLPAPFPLHDFLDRNASALEQPEGFPMFKNELSVLAHRIASQQKLTIPKRPGQTWIWTISGKASISIVGKEEPQALSQHDVVLLEPKQSGTIEAEHVTTILTVHVNLDFNKKE